MVRVLSVVFGLWVGLSSTAFAEAPDAVDGHIAELNRLMRQKLERVGDPELRRKKLARARYFSLDADRTRLQYGHRELPAYLQIPLDAPWTVDVVTPSGPDGRARVQLAVGGGRMSVGKPGKARRVVETRNFLMPTVPDGQRVGALLRRIRETAGPPTTARPAEPVAAAPAVAAPAVAEPAVAEPAVAEPAVAESVATEPAAAEPGAAEPGAAEPVAAEPSAPVPKPQTQTPKASPRPATGKRQPAFRTTVSPLHGTHTGEPVEVTVQASPNSWLTAFAENKGSQKMFQAVYIRGPDGKLVGGKKAMDAATGALRFGNIARTPTGAGGAFTIRIVPLRDSRGPFYFEGRIVHPTRAARPESDLCDGLDLLMAHIDDGLGHLVETEPTKPGMKPVPLTLAGGIEGQAASGSTWIARPYEGPKAEALRRRQALADALDGCLGPGRAGRGKPGAWGDRTQRSWTRDDVHVRLRIHRGRSTGTLELVIYKGTEPI